jgi:hypothetical protein
MLRGLKCHQWTYHGCRNESVLLHEDKHFQQPALRCLEKVPYKLWDALAPAIFCFWRITPAAAKLLLLTKTCCQNYVGGSKVRRRPLQQKVSNTPAALTQH